MQKQNRGIADTTAELLWVRIKYHPPLLLCDNQSAVLVAHNLVLHSHTKHLELDIHFVREKVLAKITKKHGISDGFFPC